MDEPKALDSLFKQKLLRIPDYQRGYPPDKQEKVKQTVLEQAELLCSEVA